MCAFFLSQCNICWFGSLSYWLCHGMCHVCSDTISLWFSFLHYGKLRLPLCESVMLIFFLYHEVYLVWHLFNSLHHVMLLSLKEDNVSGNSLPCPFMCLMWVWIQYNMHSLLWQKSRLTYWRYLYCNRHSIWQYWWVCRTSKRLTSSLF